MRRREVPSLRFDLAKSDGMVNSPLWPKRAVIIGILVLSGCGGGPRALPANESFQRLVPASQTAIRRPDFGDADPVDWPGQTPENYPVHGIDLSRYQTSVDWDTARSAGVNFAFIKATEGGDRVDPMFQTHWQGASAAGVRPGAFHFYYFCTSAAVQARWFIANVPRTPGALPPVVDVEWNPQSPTCTRRPAPAVVRSEIGIFLDIVGRHYGQRPIVYVPLDFWEDNDLSDITDEEFWLRSTADHPSETFPGADWVFWQYSGTGLVPGIGGPVDLNVFAGSTGFWRNWLARRAQ